MTDDNSANERDGEHGHEAFVWARDVPTLVRRLPYSPRYCDSVLNALTELGLFPERPTPESLAAAQEASRETPVQEMAIRVARALVIDRPDQTTEVGR